MWDPEQYLAFGDQRSRPFFDLVRRVDAVDPRRVVDLGCGPGQLTAALAARWPDADVVGVDSSAEMVTAAAGVADPDGRPRFVLADLRRYHPDGPLDVVVSNATLQWVPDHLEVLPRLLAGVRRGGWLAFQVPANFAERTHTAIAELRGQAPWRDRLAEVDVARPRSEEPATYLEALLAQGCRADVWETTYLQVLQGPDAVVRWMTGTGLRPVLAALGEAAQDEFLAAYRSLVADAYPRREAGTVLPYRRIFAVARR